MPAIVNWQQAREYCLWLGEQSNKKIDLPTESQWEYAARNRGGICYFRNE
ncbi:formylglycine-generating enzyme family protein [Yersinia pekkanenii]|nr:SUMF1/EgtB/PvdO family nonheme iron enzyme [Yersinia pekkanenii]